MHETVDNIRYSSEVDYNDSIDSGVGDRAGEDEGADDDDQDYVMGQTSGSKLVDR